MTDDRHADDASTWPRSAATRRRRRDRHRARRVPRPAGSAHGQAGHGPLLPRPRRGPATAARHRGLQLPARRRRRHERACQGYRFANWEKGYGDFGGRPDLATLRVTPWLEKTALVLCDLLDDATGEPVEVSPRQILQRQIERAAERGLQVMFGSELEFFLFDAPYDELARKDYRDPRRPHQLLVHPRLPHPPDHQGRVPHPRHPQRDAGRRRCPIEFSKGEAGPGQHEINLRYADALRWPTATPSTRTAPRRSPTARARRSPSWPSPRSTSPGSSCHIHSSCGRRAARAAVAR